MLVRNGSFVGDDSAELATRKATIAKEMTSSTSRRSAGKTFAVQKQQHVLSGRVNGTGSGSLMTDYDMQRRQEQVRATQRQ